MEENNDIPSASSSGATNIGLMPVEKLIHVIRGQQVMIDSDFMFQLTKGEAENLRSPFATSSSRSQFVTLKQGHHIKYRPYAFTENGVAMLIVY